MVALSVVPLSPCSTGLLASMAQVPQSLQSLADLVLVLNGKLGEMATIGFDLAMQLVEPLREYLVGAGWSIGLITVFLKAESEHAQQR